MYRRDFMIMGTLVGLSPYISADVQVQEYHTFKKVKKTIATVQEHMFPKGGKLPSATEIDAVTFLYEAIMHPAYDKDIRTFVIEGAQRLQEREKNQFESYTTPQKEKALREYEKTHIGKNWLSRIMVLTMEAMFSDPIYGSNFNEKGWKAIASFGGIPRPKTRYIEL